MVDRAGFDQNNRNTFITLSNAGDRSIVELWADPITHRLLVDASVTLSGTSDVNIARFGGSTVALGQNTMVNSLPVTIASNQSTLPVNMTQLNGSATATVATGVQAVGISDGTNSANVLSGDTSFNSQLISSGVKTINFTTSASGVQTLLANTDVRGYTWMEIVYTSVGVGLALTGQFSTVSGGTYNGSATFTAGIGVPGALGGVVGNIYSGPIRGNFFQLAVSALTSGTFTGTLTLRTLAPSGGVGIPAGQSGTWIVGSNSATGAAVPANAFYVAMNGASGNLKGINSYANATDGANLDTSLAAGIAVFNGSTTDRLRSATAVSGTTGTGLLGSGNLIFDGTNWVTMRASADSLTTPLASTLQVYNGSTTDRARSATQASNTTGTGLLGIGNMNFDGTNWQTQRTASIVGDGNGLGASPAAGIYAYNGITFDRARTATAANGTTGTGLLGAGNLLFDGTNWQAWRTSSTAGDASGSSTTGLVSKVTYNGATFDRDRNNVNSALIAAGTTTTQSAIALVAYNARFLTLVINITVATVATLTVTVNGASPSSYTYLLGASAALATIATTTLMFGPGLLTTTNASFNVPIPRNIQVTAAVTGTCTYGIDYILSV